MQIWERLVAAHLSLSAASREFMVPGVDRVGLIRLALRSGFDQSAGWMIESLPKTELRELFPVLLRLASDGHGAVYLFRDAIRSLPRDWVLPRLREDLPAILDAGDYDVWRCVLELCSQLDRDMTSDLATKAAAHNDPDIREAGDEYLEYLRNKKPCSCSL
ncbi:hypothetical protein [Myxococcus sp. CA040A]|uniref:hypothetical protein n=1 Tax=Myxococcus sp. CA040A TaxID=2741738 RepID=UPI00157AEE3F|nr:hypothetical protein [Myxococcus sp. CA040A]NTX00192.1 hypothetical protein [Myxococcus sp. CA040A]